jgi:transposase
MNPYPGDRSLLILDNATIHEYNNILALCRHYRILCLRLPQYSYDYNPIELCFAGTTAYYKKTYGEVDIDRIHFLDNFMDSIWNSCNPQQAVNRFKHCHIFVSDEEELMSYNDTRDDYYTKLQ